METSPTLPANVEEVISCPTTKNWYWRNMIIFSTVLLGMSAWFFYDWKFVYPAKREMYALFESHEKAKTLPEWEQIAQQKGWPSKPEHVGEHAVSQQLAYGIISGAGGLWCLLSFLRKKDTRLTIDHQALTSPTGEVIPFASMFRIDRRKWRRKGLAFVYYKNAQQQEKRIAIDDFVYRGADQLFARLEQNFKGEIIDLDELPPAAGNETDAAKK